MWPFNQLTGLILRNQNVAKKSEPSKSSEEDDGDTISVYSSKSFDMANRVKATRKAPVKFKPSPSPEFKRTSTVGTEKGLMAGKTFVQTRQNKVKKTTKSRNSGNAPLRRTSRPHQPIVPFSGVVFEQRAPKLRRKTKDRSYNDRHIEESTVYSPNVRKTVKRARDPSYNPQTGGSSRNSPSSPVLESKRQRKLIKSSSRLSNHANEAS